jgi:hypothetical protein
MAITGEVCLPPEVEYEDMVGAVVRRIKYVLQRYPNNQLDTRTQTEAAFHRHCDYRRIRRLAGGAVRSLFLTGRYPIAGPKDAPTARAG